ncbi:MAG: hypothetical protein ACRDS9_28995 [Pseudonocardiaceae bacterium]
MIREDRELLTELARVNRDIAPLAMRIMEGSAGAAEQQHYGQRLISAGQRLCRRADEASRLVIAGEVVVEDQLALPVHTVEPHWEP